MKKYYAWNVYIAVGLSGLMAADPESAITERGPHHRVLEKVTREVQADGTVLERKSTQIDLAAGLHYRDGNAWLETRELIEPHPDGGRVTHAGRSGSGVSDRTNEDGDYHDCQRQALLRRLPV